MSRQTLLRLFFHLAFWPRAFVRWWRLLLSRKKLQVDSVQLDQAFYIEGSWVWLEWKVAHAWLIRVNHPGGFYAGSDSTWFTAHPDLSPIRITIYGVGRKQRYRLPVAVRGHALQPPAEVLRQARTCTASIHQGPIYQPHTRAMLHPKTRLRIPEPGPESTLHPPT